MNDPTAGLQARLARLGVSETAWRAAARRHLSRIARDLPAFDSAWIDACARAGHLTRWQAETLCGPSPDAVFLGPFVLRSLLARDHRTATYEAEADATLDGASSAKRASKRTSRCELIVLDGLAHPDRTLKTLRPSFVAASNRSRRVAWIRDGQVAGRSLVLASSAVPGPTLRQVLTRRGRLPAAEVAAIAADLLAGLGELHRMGRAHGEVRLDRIRLRADASRGDRGGVCLMQPGVRSAVQPTIAYRAGLPLADCEAIAPERIGTHREADAAGDLFGLGCVLWELLAGRSPYPQAGPLERLRAQAESRPPSLDEYVVGVPRALAALIESCLAADPNDRPATSTTAVATLGRLRREMPRAGASSTRRPVRAATLGTAALVAVAAGWVTMQPRLSGDMTQRFAAWATPDRAAAAVIDERIDFVDTINFVDAQDGAQPLPAPNADGTVALPAGQFLASEIAWGGPLQVVGASDTGETVVVVPAGGWNLIAESVTLQNVRVEWTDGTSASGAAMVTVQSQTLRLVGCDVDATGSAAAIAWTPLDAADASGRTIEAVDGRLAADGAALVLHGPARRIALNNTAVEAGRALAVWRHRWPSRDTAVDLTHCTLRRLATVVAVDGEPTSRGQRVRVRLRATVLDPQTRGAVVMLGDVAQLADARRRVAVEADGCVTSRRIASVACAGVEPREADWLPLPQGELTLVGDELDDAAAPLAVDEWPGVIR